MDDETPFKRSFKICRVIVSSVKAEVLLLVYQIRPCTTDEQNTESSNLNMNTKIKVFERILRCRHSKAPGSGMTWKDKIKLFPEAIEKKQKKLEVY